ncbi:fumarylacetoacetate hydrolase family protein [Iamia majanohamensis]|uniref:Fumarylacetoacetate hydrolase family protein n=1 Tax=Iamia majanohamensis TaxID=467976 RepID=A0AAE9Y5P8_9ACTN|nr:fumarylacetoacetate hydrolase family protein [Iamia majanohamensis]WCO67005.1 fumarylacetoacetate hydrolase family protein [Iamia majanohamensis]
MKIANHHGRLVLVVDDGVVDVHDASDGRFGPDPADAYARWDDLRAWADDATGEVLPLDEDALGAPSPTPRQVFAIGLNYASHAEESGMDLPAVPAVFTKYPAGLTGPFAPIELSGEMVDWEVELVAVIGREADRVAEADGWDHVAGLTVGQDVSDRHVQFAAGGQFSLGKSFRSYGPTGPWLVTPDEVADRDDLALGCSLDGEVVQDDRTAGLVFTVPRLVAELSAVCPLLPGDLIFTGTPAGVGIGRTPPRFLAPGQVLESWIEGIGAIRNQVVAGGAA